MTDIEDIIKIATIKEPNVIKKEPKVIKMEHTERIPIEPENEAIFKAFVLKLIDQVGQPHMKPTRVNIDVAIRQLLRNKKDFPIKNPPSKVQLYNILTKYYNTIKLNDTFKRYLITKSMRSESGVLVVTNVLSPKPFGTEFSCPEKCAYCPTETDLEGVPTQPKSYLSSEPAMLRALMSKFDMKGQMHDRINCYIKQGNINVTIDEGSAKLEIILSGGTWESYGYDYRNKVMTELYWAANTFFKDREMLSIEEEQHINMTSSFRIIGLTIETRPDFVTWKSIKDYLRWGVTRVQLGVQHYNDDILNGVKRNCTSKDLVVALVKLKSVGMKIVCHLMPDLPGSSPALDAWMFDQAINNPDYQFDDVKIYPTAICQSSDPNLIVKSEISDWYHDGTYMPYAEKCLDDLINVIIGYKENIQPWVRIQRLVRDIPKKSMEAGYKRISNLRQIIQDKMKKDGKVCNCIRCKEIKHDTSFINKVSLVVNKYDASKGTEYFISIQAHQKFGFYDYLLYGLFLIKYYFNVIFYKRKIWWSGNPKTYSAIIGFCRLRIDPNPGGGRVKVLENSALIREVHVYGKSVNVGSSGMTGQHMGYGQLLVKTAEEISQQHNMPKIAVISGVGVREYYKKKCNYFLQDNYMIKYF